MSIQFSADEMAHAERVLDSVRDSWLKREGVTAVDLGFKWSEGSMTNRLAIRVHLNRKKPLAELTEDEKFPHEIEGVLVDVVEASYGIQIMPESETVTLVALDDRKKRYDEIPLGVSIGNQYSTAGTLGAKVIDLATEEEMILSNWHVLVGSDKEELDIPIWQPGRIDGGDDDKIFAHLSRSILGPFDAAVARLTGVRSVTAVTVDGSAIDDIITPTLGMFVWKSGRTTGRTRGMIDGIKMATTIAYAAAGPRKLEHVFRVVPRPGDGNVEISLGGDSGSIWVDEASGKAVGLHFAGEMKDQPEQALANDIQPVLQALNVRLPRQPMTVNQHAASWGYVIIRLFRQLWVLFSKSS